MTSLRATLERATAPLLFALAAAACSGTAGEKDAGSDGKRVTVRGHGVGGAFVGVEFAAARDGDGAWRILPKDAQAPEAFMVDSGRYTLAFVCAAPAPGFGGFGEVILATTAELSSVTLPCAAAPATGTVTGKIIGSPAGDLDITFGAPGTQTGPASIGSDRTSYSLPLAPGSYDITALVRSGAGTRAFVINYDVRIEGTTGPDLDLRSALLATSDPAPAITNREDIERIEMRSIIVTRRGAVLDFVSDKDYVYTARAQDLGPDDQQKLMVSGFSPTGKLRGLTRALAGPPADSYELPAHLMNATVTASGGRPKVSFARYAGAVFIQLQLQPMQPEATAWVMNVGAGWLGDATEFELPDPATIPGFTAEWAPQRGAAYIAEVTAVSSSEAFGPVLHDAPMPKDASIGFAKQVTLFAPP
jgi:hypothetical protein